MWAKCEELRIITEKKWLRTGYFQNRSYRNCSFFDLIGEKSNICGIKKEEKKEERKDTRIMQPNSNLSALDESPLCRLVASVSAFV